VKGARVFNDIYYADSRPDCIRYDRRTLVPYIRELLVMAITKLSSRDFNQDTSRAKESR
jgi:hypothetical protein